VTSTSSIQANPYLFVFGANPLGYLEFKALDNTSSLNASAKYLQVNGSTAEVRTTKANLDKIRIYTNNEPLIYADMQSDLNEANLDTTDYTNYKYTPSSASGSGIIVRPCSLLGIPFTDTSTPGAVRIRNMDSIKVLEEKMVKWANNESTSGIKPQGEMAVMAVALKNGQILSNLIVGKPGSTGGMSLNYASKFAKLITKNDDAGCLDFIYQGHTHDIISTSQPGFPLWCCTNYLNNKVVGELVTVPSETDLNSNYILQSGLSYITLISRVFAPSGNGWEFSVPRNSNLWQKYSSGTRHNESTELADPVIKAREASMKKNNHPTASQEDDKVGSLVGVGIERSWGAKLTEVVAGK
jgi:hypothetical protein